MGFKKYLKYKVNKNPKLEERIRRNPILISKLRSSYEKDKSKYSNISLKKSTSLKKKKFGFKLPSINPDQLSKSMSDVSNLVGNVNEFMQSTDTVRKMFANKMKQQSDLDVDK